MSKREPRKYDDDDGRTICDMNVPGMPWYEKDRRREERAEARRMREEQRAQEAERARMYGSDYIPLRDRLRNALSIALAGLLVVGVIGGAMVLFILFCTHVWLA